MKQIIKIEYCNSINNSLVMKLSNALQNIFKGTDFLIDKQNRFITVYKK